MKKQIFHNNIFNCKKLVTEQGCIIRIKADNEKTTSVSISVSQGGMITSPRKTGSLQYPDSTECIWELRTDPGYHTEVSWLYVIHRKWPTVPRSLLRAVLIWSCQPHARRTTSSYRAGQSQVRDGSQWVNLSVGELCHNHWDHQLDTQDSCSGLTEWVLPDLEIWDSCP